MDRSKFVRDCIMDSIANDYEDFEMIVNETNKFSAQKGIKASRGEISETLRQLIEGGYAQSYIFPAGQSGHPQPVSYAGDRVAELWFYLTPKGLASLASN